MIILFRARTIYGGTYAFLISLAFRHQTTFVDITKPDIVEVAITANDKGFVL
jgi:O-acetylhomoserine/O-acetylserine sulfhydrylase-like pyridoxal-dependent enzyme